MLMAYLNYPNRRVTVHNIECPDVQQQRKREQRVVPLTVSTISTELRRFEAREYAFASTAVSNDMWLQVDFADIVFEQAVVKHVQRILARRYTRFVGIPMVKHCSPFAD
jgi:hypothetical protein